MFKTLKDKKSLLLYGLCLGVVLAVLEISNYKASLREISMEIYGGIVALLFLFVGISLSLLFLKPKPVKSTEVLADFRDYDLSEREMDVLRLMSSGLTNKEIAEKLFVSSNTVKTHTSNIYVKLDVKRRTQAVQKARDLMIV
ncbi:MAG: response regulator transcription factor [Bacteroidota bacterium]